MPHDPTAQASVWRPLRRLLNDLDDEIDQFYAQRGITGVRLRFVGPLIRLGHRGAMSIRELADALEVTHSAMSQTVASLRREGLVRSVTGTDARTRQITLTDRARQLLPLLEAEWRATEQALRDLDAEIPYALSRAVADLQQALARRRFRDRLTAHLPPS
ncbi:MarR family transcriptional regulator [Saccharopolyspora hirsuta]|uniref:MarR family transcriptional regulator n=1 Tax=Saccharopolyspora hirsuta TaxID=1837 RepID=A0A5M7C7G8_SACHI|nr:MarR family transcriptional regulator [Saccharopolyspora hirsuta]KAA5834255.1 MarR family transcriptional regulator [Saccharopolyspora hirsuta]